MELVYLWVEDYKNIQKQGFNFSPRFNCEYNDVTKELTIDENDDYIPDFFGKNINVTAIVGKNGSGKSAILDTLVNDIIFNDKINYKRQSLYCYLNDAKDEIYINSYLVAQDNVKSNFKYKMTHMDSNNDIDGYVGCGFRYRVKLENFTAEYNKSFFYLYNNSLEEDNHLQTSVYTYNEELLFYQEVDKSNDIINLELEANKIYGYLIEYFLNKDRLPTELKDLFIPKKVFLDREIFVSFFNKEAQEEKSYREFLQNTSDLEEIIKLETLIYLRDFLNNKSFHHSCDNDISQLKKVFNSRNIINDFKNILYEAKVDLEAIDNKIKSIKKDIRHDDNRSNDSDLENLVELEKIINLMKNSSEIASLVRSIRNDPYYDYEISPNLLNRDSINVLKQLPSYLPIDFASKNRVKFSELSTGEQNILKLLFSIENIIHLRGSRTHSFNILLDEIENTLHPDWQKKIIKWLITFLKKYDNLQFNIIITSHSPFLISDIPTENIIFLKNGKVDKGLHKQTFGQNIHTLLSDTFFMENGLMGEFAKGKINEIIDFHKIVEKKDADIEALKKEYREKREKFYQTQSIVGEEYLKQILDNHLMEKDQKKAKTILLRKKEEAHTQNTNNYNIYR